MRKASQAEFYRLNNRPTKVGNIFGKKKGFAKSWEWLETATIGQSRTNLCS